MQLHAVVKGAGMGLGYQALLEDLGLRAGLRCWTDSSAAIGIASRQGLGKLRHLDAHTLWLQQAVRSKRLQLKKAPGTANPADVFTKHSLSRDKLLELVKLFDCRFTSGRAATAPALRQDLGTKTTMADYNDGLNRVDEGEDNDEQPTTIPHNIYNREQLDAEYPSLGAPPDVDDHDHEESEQLLTAGLREANKIALAMRTHGRTRRDFTGNNGNEPYHRGGRHAGGHITKPTCVVVLSNLSGLYMISGMQPKLS